MSDFSDFGKTEPIFGNQNMSILNSKENLFWEEIIFHKGI